jgi:hypothetical protein
VATSADESQKHITVANPPVDGTTIRPTNNDPDVRRELCQRTQLHKLMQRLVPLRMGGCDKKYKKYSSTQSAT